MAVQALTLMVVYVLTVVSVQFLGFLISRLVDYEWPTLGLMTFLILFLGAFGIAWPIAAARRRIPDPALRLRGRDTAERRLRGRRAETPPRPDVTPGGGALRKLPAKAARAATARRGEERCSKSRKILLPENA